VLNTFDLKSALLAKHAQHVVLVHFPIALYLSGTFFDFLARAIRRPGFREAARWNFLAAAIMSLPSAATGILAWRWALEGQHIKGILRLHFLLAFAVVLGMWMTLWLRSHRNSGGKERDSGWQLAVESTVCVLVAATAHLGGFLSGVNAGL